MLRLWELYNTHNGKRYYVVNELAKKGMLHYFGELKYGDLAADIRFYGLDAFRFTEVAKNLEPQEANRLLRYKIEEAQTLNPLYGYNLPDSPTFDAIAAADDLMFTNDAAKTAKRLNLPYLDVLHLWEEGKAMGKFAEPMVYALFRNDKIYHYFETPRMMEKRLNGGSKEKLLTTFSASWIPQKEVFETDRSAYWNGGSFALIDMRGTIDKYLSFPSTEAAFLTWQNLTGLTSRLDYTTWLTNNHNTRGLKDTTFGKTFFLDWGSNKMK